MQIDGLESFMRPIASVILIATDGMLVLPALLKKMEKKGRGTASAKNNPNP